VPSGSVSGSGTILMVIIFVRGASGGVEEGGVYLSLE